MNLNTLSKYVFFNKKNNRVAFYNLKNESSIIVDKSLLESDKYDKELTEIFKENDFLSTDYEIDSVIKNFKEKDGRILEITIFVHGDCNFRCEYCYEQFNKKRISTESEIHIIRFIEDRIKEGDFDKLFVSWFGGEPLLDVKRIFSLSEKLIELAQKYNLSYRSGMTTNAYLLSATLFQKLASFKIQSYQITIDGDRKRHNQQRKMKNGRGTYDRIIHNLYDIQNLSIDYEIMLRFNLSSDNLFSVKDFLKSDGMRFKSDSRFSLFFKSIGSWGLGDRLQDNLISAGVDAEIELSSEAIKQGFAVENVSTYLSYYSVCYGRKPNTYSIDVNGNILKCTTKMLYDERNIIGGLENSLDNNKRSYWEDDYTYSSTCMECSYFPACRGGACPIDINIDMIKLCLEKKQTIRKYLDLFFYVDDYDIEIFDDGD